MYAHVRGPTPAVRVCGVRKAFRITFRVSVAQIRRHGGSADLTAERSESKLRVLRFWLTLVSVTPHSGAVLWSESTSVMGVHAYLKHDEGYDGADILAFAPTLSSSPQTSRGYALEKDNFGFQTDEGCAFCALQTHRFRVRQSLGGLKPVFVFVFVFA